MNYSVHKRGKFYSVFFRVAGKSFYRSTGKTTKAAAKEVAPSIIEAAQREAGAGDEKSKEAYSVLERAAHLAARGHLSEDSAREMLGELLKISKGAEMEHYTVRQWLEKYLEDLKKVTEGTRGAYRYAINSFYASLGKRADESIMAIDRQDVEAWEQKQADEGKRPGTIGTQRSRVARAFQSALEDRVIPHNPFANRKRSEFAEEADEKALFEEGELRALLRSLDGEWLGMTILGLYTAARLSSIAELRWGAVDLAAGTVSFPGKKGGNAVVVPLHPDAEKWLLDQPGTDNPEAFVFPRLGNLSHSVRSRQFIAKIAEAGIENPITAPPKVTGKKKNKGKHRHKFTFHTLRHQANSIMANSGITQDRRKLITGHKSNRINDAYTHAQLEPLKDAVKTIPSLLDK